MKRAPVLSISTLILLVVSIALLFIANRIHLDATDPGVPGYIQKTNWALQPLFYPILALLIHLAWSEYLKAWRQLSSRKVLYRKDTLESDPSSVTDLILSQEKARPYLVAISIFLGLLLTAADAGCLWTEYGVFEPPRVACSETDFTIAFRLPAFSSIPPDPSANGWFVVVAYLMQGALISYGWVALLELSLHSYCFLKFENLRTIKPHGLRILLNYNDELREFGLTDVNRAINITYVFIALGMFLPVLSAYWNPNPDFGQWMLRILLPLILLVPAVIPIVERSSRIEEAGERMRRDPNPQAEENYAKQSLWPFEKTQIGYVGKTAALICLGEYIYLITRNIKDLF